MYRVIVKLNKILPAWYKMSDMLPNAWFYKLNHMSTGKLQNLTHKFSNKKVQSKTKSSPFSSSTAAAHKQTCHLRKSYYFNLDFKSTSHLSERRKSSDRRCDAEKIKASPKLIANFSVSDEYPGCHVSHESVYSTPHMMEQVQNDSVFYDLDAEFKRVNEPPKCASYIKLVTTQNRLKLVT
ncbi:uncharacterized protein LOC135150515 [Daucus carota subsp. sativus]|uniref:uncharacterized protein LOC135150515 n=1 Tax=Daucus carota subsp. sativus TaxID=79200 RepID=UPI003082A4AC